MLLLQRKIGESIYIGDDIKLTVLDASHSQVRIGIQAPRDIAVHREEIYERIKREEAAGGSGNRADAKTESSDREDSNAERKKDGKGRAMHPFRRNVQHRNQD